MISSPISRGALWSGLLKIGDYPPAVTFLIGQEGWLKDQAIARFKKSCLAPGFEEVDLTRFSETPALPSAILEALQTAPFGSPRRLVIVEGLSEVGESTFSWLTPYLARPNPKAALGLCAEKLEGNKPIFLREQRAGRVQILFCQPLKGRELEAWLVGQAQLLHKELKPPAAGLLIRRLGNNLKVLESALESLALYCGSSPAIDAKAVEALISPSVKETAFDILDQAASGFLGAAIGLLRQALAQGKISVEQLMGALGWIYRMAWKSKQTSTPSSFGWGSRDRQLALERLSRWSFAELEEALEEVLEADASIKLGNPAPELLANRLLLRLGGVEQFV